MSFTFPIEKEGTRIDKNGEEITTKNTFYILKYIDCASFMPSLLSNLAINIPEGVHRIKFKYRNNDKKCKTGRIKYNYCDFFWIHEL